MILVLDASAMIAFLRDEPGAEVVESFITSATDTCVAHALNCCEVYYDFMRAADEATAKSAIADIESLGVTIREDMKRAFWQDAGNIKADHRVSLADCVAMTLANRTGGELLTSDHHEMNVIAAARICRIRFIR